MTPTEKLIRDFVDEVRQKDLKVCQVFDIANVKHPLYVTISDQWDNPMIEIDFPFAHSAHIYTMYDKRAEDLERYSWLFSRVAELFRDLKKWSTSDEA